MLIIEQVHEFLYGQVSLFEKGLINPYNRFTDEEYQQGFSYRKRSVSFRTPFSSAQCEIKIFLEDRPSVNDSIFVIEVPFIKEGKDSLCIASVSDGEGDEVDFNIPAGSYSLFFEAFSCNNRSDPEDLQRINFFFAQNEDPRFSIVKNNWILRQPDSFHTNGQAA